MRTAEKQALKVISLMFLGVAIGHITGGASMLISYWLHLVMMIVILACMLYFNGRGE